MPLQHSLQGFHADFAGQLTPGPGWQVLQVGTSQLRPNADVAPHQALAS